MDNEAVGPWKLANQVLVRIKSRL